METKRQKELSRKSLKTLVKELFEYSCVRWATDCGPDNEGWQSSDLKTLIHEIEERIK